MPYDSMASWDRNVFQFNDAIQKRGGTWRGQLSFDSDVGRTISRDDYVPPSPPASAKNAPRFTDATLRWSPRSSPRTRSLRASPSNSPPQSPRIDSARPLDTPPTSPLTQKEQNQLADQLYVAACAGDLPHIRLLLSLGAPINTPTLIPDLYDAFRPPKPGCLSALAGAAGSQQLEAVTLLLSHGAALNPTMKQSSSAPLHQACKADDVTMAHHLLRLGADVNALNCYKTTPLMYAVKYGSPTLVRELLSHNPDLHILSFINTAAIHWAVWPGRPEIMELLLRAGADPDQAMGDGSTPLHCAAGSGLGEVVEMLLKFGADPGRRNLEWRTPGQVAEEQGFGGIAEVLARAPEVIGGWREGEGTEGGIFFFEG